MSDSDLVRFWARVDIQGPDDCWEWTRGCDHYGYGAIKIGRRMMKAHRVMYALGAGLGSKDKVLHHCDNPPCCNPAHLFRGTQAQNMADMQAKGRGRYPHKLSDSTVAAIKAACCAGESQRRVATRFGITQSGVSRIVTGKRTRP